MLWYNPKSNCAILGVSFNKWDVHSWVRWGINYSTQLVESLMMEKFFFILFFSSFFIFFPASFYSLFAFTGGNKLKFRHEEFRSKFIILSISFASWLFWRKTIFFITFSFCLNLKSLNFFSFLSSFF